MSLTRREFLIGTGTLIGGAIVAKILDQRRFDQCEQKKLQSLTKIIGGRPLTDYEKHTARQSCEQELNK